MKREIFAEFCLSYDNHHQMMSAYQTSTYVQ